MAKGLDGEVYGESYQSQISDDHYSQLMPSYSQIIPIELKELETDDPCKKSIRTKKFSPEEDLVLVSAWLNTSIDPIIGTDQTNIQYWRKVGSYYKAAIENTKYGPRTDKSLTNRWSTIQQALNKFCGYYTQREGSLRKSGDTGIDVLQEAKKIYHEIQKTQFRLENCWNKLRFNAKWIEYIRQGPTKRKVSSGDTINCDDEENTSNDFIDLERPMGQKKAKKEAKRGKGKSADISEFDNAIIKWTEEKMKNEEIKVEIAKQHLKIQKAKMDADQEKSDIATMMIDVSKMENVVQREYFTRLQADILARKLN
ncbi:glutathione S-transferase T3-like [Impatiens glandulifera]|uniref:glutathione S-transferase T3-like n=1 Tax=Impatiens glandulifera TaxID=253017 RepID=UPI001FB07FFB|nr:glutathione S-transferase T3-like [Impatiens glandulifera]